MTPSIWVLLLMFLLGAALTWFAMVRSVTRQVGGAQATSTVATGPATTEARYRGDASPREGTVAKNDEVRGPDHPDHR